MHFKNQIIRYIRANSRARLHHTLNQTQMLNTDIYTGDRSPIKTRPYENQFIKMRHLFETGIIKPRSFLIVLANKKDGHHKFCVDIKALNNIRLPLDDILTLLGKTTSPPLI